MKKNKFDPSKINTGEPTPINETAGTMLIDYLKANKPIINRDLGLTLEHVYNIHKGKVKPIHFNRTRMSDEVKEWAGLSLRDPFIGKVRINKGVFAGSLHTYSTILHVHDEMVYKMTTEVIGLIEEQIELYNLLMEEI